MPKPKGWLSLSYDEQLQELEDELKRGHVYEASLRSEKWVLNGLQEGEDIFLDPRTAIVETVIHELIHRRKPKLSERTVDTLAKKLLAHLDETGKWKWYKAYLKIRKKSQPIDLEDGDD